MQAFYVYLLECSDGSLYTGIALDVARRVDQHNRGKGAKYTRGRGPVRVVAVSAPMPKGEALRLELRAKKLKGEEKQKAILAMPITRRRTRAVRRPSRSAPR